MRQTNIDDDDDDFPGGICRDGGSVRVSTTFMDSRRRFTPVTDAEARKYYQPGFRGRDAGSQPDPAAAAYEISKSRLSNAWRGPSCTPYAADPDDFALAERLAPLLGLSPPMRASSAPLDPRFTPSNKPMRGSEGADARCAAYDAMVARGQSAWKTPAGRVAIAQELEDRRAGATDPAKAVKIEKQLEGWQGRPIEELQREVEVKRRKIRADHEARLFNAWRGSR